MEKGFYAFGTMNFVRICSPLEENTAKDLLCEIQDLCQRLDDMWSVFKPSSEISRINAAAGKEPVSVSPITYDLLRRAKEISEVTNGAFDITMGPAIRLWNIGHESQRVPKVEELETVKGLVDSKSLILERETQTAFLKRTGQSIDLGGIAKGYAADLVKTVLISRGVNSALLNFGGTIITIGRKVDGSPWCVGIQNPLMERGISVGRIWISDGVLVTSAVNERFFEVGSIRYHHLLDPRTCAPARSGVLSVTAAGDCATELDGLTTALFVMGAEKGIPFASKLGIDVLYLTEDGNILGTRGFAHGKYKFQANELIRA
jgi:thiamine biosynthesis lipoprotein